MDAVERKVLRIFKCFKRHDYECDEKDACSNEKICKGFEKMIEEVTKEE